VTSIKDQIKKLASSYFEEVVQIRRHLHANPELSFEEFKTSEYIKQKLTEYGISFQAGFVKTGIVGIIEGKAKGKAVGLRADMDALPITEKNNVSYKSCNEGIMHACGHDVHMSCLLGAAKILNQLKDQFNGTVKLIFQPGEEKLPGGASLMIKEGVLENPKPDVMFALHVFPSMEAGKVGFREGMYMASTDELYLTVKGKGGHAALPSSYNSPLLIASKVLLALDDAFMNPEKRDIPDIPTVIAFGKISGLGATNVIPEVVEIEGTFRTMNEEWRAKAHDKMKAIANDVARENGGEVNFNVMNGYPFLVNDISLTKESKQNAAELLGEVNVEDLDLRMTAEDFAFFSQKVPSCFFRLGTGNKEKNIISGVHTSTFDIDEKALQVGMEMLAWLSFCQLK